jgi:hypothetical protein
MFLGSGQRNKKFALVLAAGDFVALPGEGGASTNIVRYAAPIVIEPVVFLLKGF